MRSPASLVAVQEGPVVWNILFSPVIFETIVTVDGMERQDEAIPLVDDRRNRSVEIVSIRSPFRL